MRKNKLVPLGPTPDHTTDARKMVSRQQIREVFLRNGFTIKPGCDDLREYVYKAAFELLELAAPAAQGEPVGFVNPEFVRRLGVTFEAIVLSSEAGRDRTMPLYTTPQPAEQQQPSRQSPPDDPLGWLEYRADGESNFYTLSRPTGNWVARIQFNGELHTHEQERILSAMLSDRNVRYGDGYHQGYWDARQEAPDVTHLVEALESIAEYWNQDSNEGAMRDACEYARSAALAALAAYRKKGGE